MEDVEDEIPKELHLEVDDTVRGNIPLETENIVTICLMVVSFRVSVSTAARG